MNLFIIAKPTPNDPEYFNRWKEVCNVLTEDDPYDPAKVDAILTDYNTILDDTSLRPFTQLRYILTPTTGLTHLDFDHSKYKIISLRHCKQDMKAIKSVSEYVMQWILNISRMHNYRMNKIGNVINGKTLGIIGMGRIGTHVSKLANAFGMSSMGYDVHSDRNHLDNIFKESDFISIHITEEGNKGFIDSTLLESMKPGSWLINTARASIIDELKLQQLIREKRVAGAVLDVTDDPGLWTDLPVYLTFHTAGFTLEDRIRTDELILNKFKAEIQSLEAESK